LKEVLSEISVLFSYPRNLITLAIRIILAYEFATLALIKLNDLQGTQAWFTQMSVPFPALFAYLVSGLETIGIVLLALGLFTRQISLLLSVVMLGAIIFVHAPNGLTKSPKVYFRKCL